jgi:glycosyltransferase involved in cell wall biosynthesis
MANLLERKSHEIAFRVLTRHHDYLDPEPYSSVPSGKWVACPGGLVYYAKDAEWFSCFLETIRTWQPDWIYLNGLFAPMTRKILYATKPGVPMVLAPHGNLGPAALKQGWFKKQLWLIITKDIGRFRHIRWHAASAREADQIRNHIGSKLSLITLPMAPATNTPKPPQIPREKGILKLVYFGRLSPEKNLNFAFDRLHEFADTRPDIQVYYDLYSADKSAISIPSPLPDNLTINHCPGLPADALRDTIMAGGYSAVLMPSLTENFSYTVLESMQAAVSPLISDQTPWRNLNTDEIGWDLPLSARQAWLDALHQLADETPEEWQKRRARVHAYATRWAANYDTEVTNLFSLSASKAIS